MFGQRYVKVLTFSVLKSVKNMYPKRAEKCRVYTDGIQMIGEDMNAEMVEPAYTTAYFYAD